MRRARHSSVVLLIFGMTLLPLACSNKYVAEERRPESGATLEGTVTYGTEKLKVALVIVQGPNGSANGFISEDGRFKIENVPLGEVNIAVNTEAGRGQLMSKMMAQSQGKAKGIPRVIEVPAKYADPAKSGLKTKINAGANEFNVVIPR